MNVSGGDDLYVSGFPHYHHQREPRFDRDDVSLAKSINSSSNRSPVVNKSDSSGSPLSQQHQQPAKASHDDAYVGTSYQYHSATGEGPIERDFYRNPTILSRMILFGKYANANRRCRDRPEEASVWVCAKRKSNVIQVSPFYGIFEKRTARSSNNSTSLQTAAAEHQPTTSTPTTTSTLGGDNNTEYSLRQLPIHIACTSLAFARDTHLRSELEQLIVRLVVLYPEGCAEFDHGGKLPLHEAIWSNATPETIAMLLMASPKTIDQRDKFGRTPRELNARRIGVQNKTEISDMLDLGVAYWDHARQEARLRMKLAVIPPANQSVASTSVMGTSQVDKETIVTTDTANFNSTPLPKDIHDNSKSRRRRRIEFKTEEIIPMAWEQLERRVILLERLLAEMYEKNYELAGLVQALQTAKKALSKELQAARAAQHRAATTASSIASSHAGMSSSSEAPAPASRSTGSRWSSMEPSVAVVPEDDEMSSVKLMEHTERIEQLESLVGSYHSNLRKRRFAGGSRVSELSSFSSHTGSHTGEGAFVRDRRMGLGRSDSLVSGLTVSEASFFDTSIHAVKEAWHNDDHDDDDDDDDTSVDLMGDSGREVTELLGTDNLNEMFHKVAEMYGSSQKISTEVEPSPRSSAREWAAPIAIASPAPTNTPPNMPFGLETSPMAVEEDEGGAATGASLPSLSSAASTNISMDDEEESRSESAPQNAGEIYFPVFLMEPEPANVNSTISISASSADADTMMSENTTIVSDENEIYVALRRGSQHSTQASAEDESTADQTMSTRARVEHLVFGGANHNDNDDEETEAQTSDETSTYDPTRFNYDITIPALDTFYADGRGEI